jgi:ATP-dependent Lon protease
MPLVALKDSVLFPGILSPLYIGREKSLLAIDEARKSSGEILLVTQKNITDEDPKHNELYDVAVKGRIIQAIKLPNQCQKILVEVEHRVRLTNISDDVGFMTSQFEHVVDEPIINLEEALSYASDVMIKFSEYAKLNKKISADIFNSLKGQYNPGHVCNLIASHIITKISEKQKVLELTNVTDRLRYLCDILDANIALYETEFLVQQRVKKQVEKTQRDYYLNEQMKAIQKELGDDEKSDMATLEQKINNLKLSDEAREKANSEVKKLKHMNSMSAEAGVIRSYLDVLLGLPWGVTDKVSVNIKKAEAVLQRDHYGLEKVKERILEYIAVLQRSKKLKGPILCLMGPPGVGKTSLVKSIAEAIGRKYVKFSLGGMKDESEIRGHRKTYIGSMPGKILRLLSKCKSSNPVMLLDEIDKLGSDFRGDPANALLEVLDPSQNSSFADHYLEVELK